MTAFEQFWSTIETRNNWKPDTVVEVKVSGLKKLVEQAWTKGASQGRASSKAVEDLLGRMGM